MKIYKLPRSGFVHIVISRSNKIDEDIEEFKIDVVDDEKNFAVSRIKLCRDPDTDTEKPTVFYS